jgi:hypothetical protein
MEQIPSREGSSKKIQCSDENIINYAYLERYRRQITTNFERMNC